jgi:glutamate formiminotransferase/formiminotetrahydrofolate cyclodeaminase
VSYWSRPQASKAQTARACAAAVELAERVAARGKQNAVSDAGVGALLAEAACRGAAYNVRINVAALSDRSRGAALVEEAERLAMKTAERARSVTQMVEKAIG